jgi:hypothetical protein
MTGLVQRRLVEIKDERVEDQAKPQRMMCMAPSVVTVANAATMAMATNTVGQVTMPR